MTGLNSCPKCGGPLPNDGALGGGCPRCMLELGFDTSVGSRESPDPGVAAERPKVIGRYRILRLIGEGGMGAVYEAEQDHPRRTVALKIIKSGMASPELLRRFEQESQALGRLQHPGIAQIYEAGTVDTGFGPQPYFAMELIRGQSPRDYAEANHLNARDRLQMMVKICDAVHHAHQRGLIHRDLKPGNIVVDETGQPKILDFGVARVTDSDSRATQQTDMGQLIGTLAYMSPEQALADPLDIDTRSDVYSLGVILYELLSGRLPYTISKKVHEAIQAIREEDPARLSSSNRTFRGDIETIVAKALEKERERRYASAAEMAADIQRYLNDEPIIARRPSASYQLQKFARRNKTFVTGVAAVFAVLVVGLAAFAWQAAVAGKERDRALKAEGRANDNEREATQALAMETDLRHVAEDLRVRTEAQALVTKQALGAAELNLYFNNIALADREWSASNIAHVDQLLKEAPAALRNWEWRYLTRRNHMEAAVLTGHQAPIIALALDADGNRLRSVDRDYIVKDWDIGTHSEITTRTLAAPAVSENIMMALSANGRTLYARVRPLTSGDPTFSHKFWDPSTGKEVFSFLSVSGLSRLGSTSNPAGLTDSRQQPLQMLPLGGTSDVSFGPVALSPDGGRLMAASNDSPGIGRTKLRSWDIGTGRELPMQGDYKGIIWGVVFSPDGAKLAVVVNSSISIVNGATGQELVTIENSRQFATVAFSPDSAIVAAGILAGGIRAWKTADGKERWSIPGGIVTKIAFSPDSHFIAAALIDRTIRILDSETGQEEARLSGHTGVIHAISFTPDGSQLLSAGDDKIIRMWDVRDLISRSALNPGRNSSARVSPGGNTLRISTDLFNLELRPFALYSEIEFARPGYRSVVPNSTVNTRSIPAKENGEPQMSEYRAGQGVAVWHQQELEDIFSGPPLDYFRTSPVADRVAVVSSFVGPTRKTGYKIQIGEIVSSTLITSFILEDTLVNTFRLSPSGKLAAMFTIKVDRENPNVRPKIDIYDTTTGHRLERLDVDTVENPAWLVFSPDGNRLAEGRGGRTITIWDVRMGMKLMAIPDIGNIGTSIKNVAFSPDGTRLVSFSTDGGVWLWDAKSGRALIALGESTGSCTVREVKISIELFGQLWHRPSIGEKQVSISFSQDGQQIILTTVTPDPAGVNVRIQTWDGTPVHR